MIVITVSGVKDFKEFAREFQRELLPAILETFGPAFAEAINERREELPMRTGRLRSMFRAYYNPAENAVIIEGPEYLKYLVTGTKPHEIRPVHAHALRFESQGEVVFAKLVFHPGTQPHIFFKEGFELGLGRGVELAAKRALDKVIREPEGFLDRLKQRLSRFFSE